MMYKIYIWTRRPRGRGLVYYLCHPAFAMTGALVWQVNHYLNKIIVFVFLRGRSHGDFPGSPSDPCPVSYSLLDFALQSLTNLDRAAPAPA
ncbi:hypothetical protein OIU84_030066 [Salix udensis]|uniref:Uncharacterized protein n=1 Tax=Salix udensis TaxID=889485 RepID=A0AAD6P7P4_9ROSI|nr:hypothetical protein OIU84_030066 [Salix udensis]